jgi:hydroxymethylpyrimidine pyrophosphatase-like HAD family hydrolase
MVKTRSIGLLLGVLISQTMMMAHKSAGFILQRTQRASAIVPFKNSIRDDDRTLFQQQLFFKTSWRSSGGPVFGMALGGSSNSSNNNNNNNDSELPFVIPPSPGSTRNGISSGSSLPDKGNVYSNDELWDLLQFHDGLSDQMKQRQQQQSATTPTSSSSITLPGEQVPAPGQPSLHDLVLQILQEQGNDNDNDNKQDDDDDQATRSNTEGEDAVEESITILQRKVKDIIAIASDVDGTLLTSQHKVHPRTEQAIRQAVRDVTDNSSAATNDNDDDDSSRRGRRLQYFFPATGKTRKGALDSLGPDIKELLSQLPGVFIQGLYCVDHNGKVLFERKLTSEAIRNAEKLGASLGITLLGYDGDNLYSNNLGDPALCAEIHDKWGEPRPESIASLADHSNGLHKILFMHQDAIMLTNKARPELHALANENDASVTQAIPTMLELLPRDCSKALGVEKLCQALGIDPTTQLLAIGDAENDIGMLKMAAIGVAVNNAGDAVKAVADYVMDESNDEGGAGVAMERFSPLRRHS